MVGNLLNQFVKPVLVRAEQAIARELNHAFEKTAFLLGKKTLQPAFLTVKSGQRPAAEGLRQRFENNILKMSHDGNPGAPRNNHGGGAGSAGDAVSGLAGLGVIGTVVIGLGALVLAIPGCSDFFFGITGQTPPGYKGSSVNSKPATQSDTTQVRSNNANMLGK